MRRSSLPLDRLSTADQAYIRKQQTGPENPVGAADLLAPSSRRVTLELLTGAQVTGRIVASDDQSVTLETVMGGRTHTRKYPRERLLAVVKDEQRIVLNAESVQPRVIPVRKTEVRNLLHRPRVRVQHGRGNALRAYVDSKGEGCCHGGPPRVCLYP